MTKVVNIEGTTLYLGDCREILPTLPKVDDECQFCGAEMEEGEGDRAMGLICDNCIDDMEWDDYADK